MPKSCEPTPAFRKKMMHEAKESPREEKREDKKKKVKPSKLFGK